MIRLTDSYSVIYFLRPPRAYSSKLDGPEAIWSNEYLHDIAPGTDIFTASRDSRAYWLRFVPYFFNRNRKK
jgi:hypothetical protein